MDLTLILSPFIGGAIGYFTNWLAIKMIFRPYEPKYFFGMKIPFTPGLMAKERYRMSLKIGDTVSNHLLSEEALFDAISEKDFTDTINIFFQDFTNYLKNSNNNIKDELISRTGENYYTYKDNIEKALVNNIIKYFENPVLQEQIATWITETVKDIINNPDTGAQIELFSKKIWSDLTLKSQNYVGNFKEDTRIISDVVDPEIIEKIKEIIKQILPDLLIRIRIFIESEEKSKLDVELSALLGKIINDSYGKFVSVLINPDKIYENGKVNFLEYISHNQEDIIEKIFLFIDNQSKNEICQIAKIIPDSGYNKVMESIFQKAQIFIGEDLSKDNFVKTIYKFFPDIGIKIKQYVHKTMDSFLKNKGRKITTDIVSSIFSQIENIKISTFASKILNMNLKNFENTLDNLLKKAIKKGGINLLKGLEINKLVEEKVNDMDLHELEQIVTSVAEREIKSITLVGGLLGFVIGGIPLLLSLIN